MELYPPEKSGFSSKRLSRINDLMQRYIDAGKLAGMVSLVARHGRVCHLQTHGYRDLSTQTAMEDDTIFRIYSMTKPITCAALMMLYEQSLFNLTDPIDEYISAFKYVKVWTEDDGLVNPIRPITIQDLLRHTAGLTYGGFVESATPIDKLYDEADLYNPTLTNQGVAERIANLPLLYHPGTKWHYSMATDIVGYLVEVLSGKTLADFMQEHIFDPLGMGDTAFHIEASKIERFATLYGKKADNDDLGALDKPANSVYLPPITNHTGGHGLVSTISDYWQFAQCILNRGNWNDVRLLAPRTVGLMTCNHLPTELLPIAFEGSVPMLGMGYGLGFGVMLDVAQTGMMGSVGDHGWGGYAETYFWIDPTEEMVAILMAQYLPSQTYPIRQEFRTAVYQALIE
ncbi:MAG: beta-lactamase family protein [Chloroflexi bacterium]|nr:beta-lactamase family protein [Chloroflexota bacterium]